MRERILGGPSDFLKKQAEEGFCTQVGGALFFPEEGPSPDAKKACELFCNVKEECGEYAIQNGEEVGIWGAMNAREIRAERRRRGL
jgi:WhiB family redox-sensing transcriptional regulator